MEESEIMALLAARTRVDPSDSQGHAISNLNVALIVVTIVRSLGWDDLLATFAWGNAIALSCVEVILVTKGVGTHMDKVPKEALNELFSTIKRVLILILAIFVIVSTFVRVALLLTTDLSTDTTYKMLRTQSWFPIEIHVGLWCGCLLALEPLVDPSSNPRNYNHYSMRKLSRSSAWEAQDDPWQRDLMTANPRVSVHGMPRDSKGKRKASNAESEADVEMLQNERGIKLTTEFSVHVENGDNSREGLDERVSKTPAWSAF
ncbi:hypothetical protein FLONG3_2726 [Fusarium longipes]|uniref:Rhodopsin domain-containing protein n=1 Tax=Fusarium longipes TaxID=694270 RepID=A0A395T4K7_9HYPO|nr:hypothetical protein FLONG3_2726 [Fusarium longipes]